MAFLDQTFSKGEILLGISGLWCSIWARSKPREEATFRGNVRGDLSRSIFTNTHTYVYTGATRCAPVDTVRLSLSLSLPIEPCVRSDIQIAAKPALNGTRSSDVDVLKSCVEIKICPKIR